MREEPPIAVPVNADATASDAPVGPPRWRELVGAAEHAWLRGDDADAQSLLLRARMDAESANDPAGRAEILLALAAYAFACDQQSHAVLLLEQLNGGLSTGRAGINRYDLRCTPLTEHVRLACSRAEFDGALRLPAEVQPHGDGPLRVVWWHRTAEASLAAGDIEGAEPALHAAVELAGALGWRRVHGRLLLRYGVAIAPICPVRGGPMHWIARAAQELRVCATWRDRRSLFDAFRVHGRRLVDKATTEELAARIGGFEETIGACQTRVVTDADRLIHSVAGQIPAARSIDNALGPLDDILASTRVMTSTVALLNDEFGEMLSSAVADRDRMGMLVQALSALESITDVTPFAAGGARVAAQLLGADLVVVARLEGSEVQCLASHPVAATDQNSSWRGVVEAEMAAPSMSPATSSPPAPRSETAPVGATLTALMVAPPFRGAIYAGNPVGREHFRESDRVLLALLGGYLGLGLARLLSREAERTALAQLGTTLDTIRDGVLTLDDHGVVLRANEAALRMLRMTESALVGVPLADHPELASLEAVVSKGRVDAEVVSFRHGRAVVTVRPMGRPSEHAEKHGVVATFVPLDRARELAYRVTGVRPRYTFGNMVCASPELERVVGIAKLAAATDAGVLITGESGTGKEVIAQAIHMGGSREQEPFVGINCAALPRELLEAELFGYEHGAFTGARSDGHAGKFEQAGLGTILLDEIGDMPLEMQAKLLRVLEERGVVRIGGNREIPVRARVIATTNRNLEESVARQTFRLDLLYRLRVLHIHIPPLRDRRRDIPALAVHILKRVASGQRKRVDAIAPVVQRTLAAHDWPGNARELANVLETEVTLLSPGARVLDVLQTAPGGAWAAESPSFEPISSRLAPLPAREAPPMSDEVVSMAETQRRAYVAALQAHGGNVTEAARALGVSRTHLYAKLKKWGWRQGRTWGPLGGGGRG